MNNVHIKLGPGREAAVLLDGFNVASGLRGLTLEASATGDPQLTLDLAIFEHLVEGEAKVHIRPEAYALLQSLGWTPPDAQPDPHRSAPALTPATTPG